MHCAILALSRELSNRLVLDVNENQIKRYLFEIFGDERKSRACIGKCLRLHWHGERGAMLNDSRSPLPGEQDTLLLRAALLPGQSALDAFATWRKTLDLDALDFGSQRVLPLLVNNLRSLGVEDPIMQRFQGVGRYAWYLNQILIGAVRPILQGLSRSNLPFVLLKGIAFVASIPDQLSLRAMTDIDLLVHQEDAASAMEILEQLGWLPYYGRAKFVRQELTDRVINCDFHNGPHGHLDLHWYVLERNRWAAADAALWRRRMPARLAGEECYAPCFEDQVLHTFVHGAPWNGVGTIRWVTDSTIILRHAKETFDWDYFLAECHSRRVILQVRNCLKYLRRHLDVRIPERVMRALRRKHVPWIEVLDYKLRARNPATLGRYATAFLSFQNYRASEEALTKGRSAVAMRRWIKHVGGGNSLTEASARALLAARGRPPWLRAAISRVWRRDGRLVRLGRRGAPNLQDQPLDLSLSGDPKGALIYGWSEPEQDGRWTDGPEAALVFEVGTARQSPSLLLSVFALYDQAAPQLRVEIWINGERLDDWLFDETCALPHTRVLSIPGAALSDRYQVLTFVIRDPKSPKSLGVSDDVRQLGLFVHKITLRPSSPADSAPCEDADYDRV